MKGETARLEARCSGGPPESREVNRPPELQRAEQEQWEDEELLPDMTVEPRRWWLGRRRERGRER